MLKLRLWAQPKDTFQVCLFGLWHWLKGIHSHLCALLKLIWSQKKGPGGMTLVRLWPSHSFVSFLYARRKCTYRSYNLHWMPHGDWWRKGYLVRFHDMFCSIWKYQRHQNRTTYKIILWFCHPSFTHMLPCVSFFFSRK